MEGLRPPGTGDNIQTREAYTLGRFQHLGLMEYRDFAAYYCKECERVINVKCAKCGARSTYSKHLDLGNNEEDIFTVDRPLNLVKRRGLIWTIATCQKCDFRFQLIVR